MPAAIAIVCSRTPWPRRSRRCWSALRPRKEQSARSTIPRQLMCRSWRGRNTVHAVRRALRLSSGVAFREQTYQPDDDIINFDKACWGIIRSVPLPAPNHTRDAPPNTRFAYASSETEVLGLVVSLRSACRLPTILRREFGKSSAPVPRRLGHHQQGKKWLTAASSPRYATGRASD